MIFDINKVTLYTRPYMHMHWYSEKGPEFQEPARVNQDAKNYFTQQLFSMIMQELPFDMDGRARIWCAKG